MPELHFEQSTENCQFAKQVVQAFDAFAVQNDEKYQQFKNRLLKESELSNGDTDWISLNQFKRYIKTFVGVYGDQAPYQATLQMYTLEKLSIWSKTLGLIISPLFFFKLLPRFAQRMNTYNSYKFETVSNNLFSTHGILTQEYSSPKETELNSYLCDCCRASIEGSIKKLNYQLIEIKHFECIKNGYLNCKYEISWRAKLDVTNYVLWGLIVLAACVGILAIDGSLLSTNIAITKFFLVFLIISFASILFWVKFKNKSQIKNAFLHHQEIFDLLRNSINQQNQLNTQLMNYQHLFNNHMKLANIGELSYGILHDMASPISVLTMTTFKLNSLLDKLQSGIISPEDFSKSIQIIERSTGKLTKMQNILRKTLSEDQSIEFESVAIGSLVTDTMDFYTSTLNKNEIKFQITMNISQECLIQTSELTVSRILMNAIQNAINILKKQIVERRLTLQVENEDHWITVKVTDNGPGIKDIEKLDLYKERLKSSSSNTETMRGTGFGLHNMAMLASNIDAKLEIRNVQPQGLCVELKLPKIIRGKQDL